MEKYAVPLGIKLVLAWTTYREASWNYVKGYVQGPSPGYNTSHWKHVWMDK